MKAQMIVGYRVKTPDNTYFGARLNHLKPEHQVCVPVGCLFVNVADAKVIPIYDHRKCPPIVVLKDNKSGAVIPTSWTPASGRPLEEGFDRETNRFEVLGFFDSDSAAQSFISSI